MPSRTVTIEIKSLADLKGLTNTIQAMSKMTTAANKLNNAWSNAADAKTMASAMRSMGTALKNIETHGPGAVDTVKKFSRAMGQLDKALAGVPIELKELAAAMRQTAASTKSWNDQNKALNKQSEILSSVTNKLDRYGKLRERITRTEKTRTARAADGTLASSMNEEMQVLEKFDRFGKLISKTTISGGAAGGIGAISTSMNVLAHSVQTVQSRMAPFLRVLTLLQSAVGGIGSRAFNFASRAVNSFGNTAQAMFARLRSALATSGGLFTAFHKRVEDSMARSKRATIDFLNSGWSFLTSGYTTRAFGQGVMQTGGRFLTDYMEYERNLIRTGVAGSAGPEVIQELVFGMQRGAFGQEPVKQFSAEEIAEAAYYYASALGQEITTENMGNLAPVLANFLQIANVTRTAPEVVTKGIINAATEFGIDPRQVENIPELQDIGTQMAYLSNISTLEFADIAESFKMVGPMAAQLGATPQDAMALLFLMSEAGLRGGQAGRGISQTFSRLIDPTDKMLGLSEEYGMTPGGTIEQWRELFFEDGQLRGGVGGLLATLQTTTETPEQMAQIVAELFSENATRSLIGTLAQLFKDEGKFADIVQELTGTMPTDWLGRAITENNDSLAASFNWLKAAWFQVVATMIDSIKGPLIGAFDALTDILFRLSDALRNNPGISRFITGLFAIVGILAQTIGTIFIAIGSTLLMAKAFSLTSGFGLRFGGVIAGIGATFARLIPTFTIASALFTTLFIAWREDFLGIASFFRSIDIVSLIDSMFANVTKAFVTFSKAWFEFISLLIGGGGTTENLRAVLETVFGDFLGTTLFGQVLRLRDAVQGLIGDLSGISDIGAEIDFRSAFQNLGPALRGLMTYAVSGVLTGDAEAGYRFFDALGFEEAFSVFLDLGERLRVILGGLSAMFAAFKNAVAPSLSEIYDNIVRIISVLTSGQVVMGTFSGFVAALAGSLAFMASAIATATGVIASLLERFRGLIPIVGAAAGVIASIFVAKAIIPFDKKLFHATATLIDFTTRVILVGALQAIFMGLSVAAQAAFAAISVGARAAVATIYQLAFSGVVLRGSGLAAQLTAIGEGLTGGLLGGRAAMFVAAAGIIVLLVSIGIAIRNLWQENENFRERVTSIWNSLKGIFADFAQGFLAGFITVLVGGIQLLVVIFEQLINALSFVLDPVLQLVDRFNILTAVGVVLGAALAALTFALAVDFLLAIGSAVAGLAVLMFEIGVFAAEVVIAAVSAIASWVASMIVLLATFSPLIIAIGLIVITVGVLGNELAKLLGFDNVFEMLGSGFKYVADAAGWLLGVVQDVVGAVTNLFHTTEEEVIQLRINERAGQFQEYTSIAAEYATRMYDPYGANMVGLQEWYEGDPNRAMYDSFDDWYGKNVNYIYDKYYKDKMDELSQAEGSPLALLNAAQAADEAALREIRSFNPADRYGLTERYDAGGAPKWLRDPIGEVPEMWQGITESLSLDSILGFFGIDPAMFESMSDVQPAEFTSIEDFQEAQKAEARQLAIEERYRELEQQYRAAGAGQDRLNQAEYQAVQASLLAQATAEVDAGLGTLAEQAQQTADDLAAMTETFMQSIQSIDLGQALAGLFDPLAGMGQQSAASALYGVSGTILENLKTTLGVEELPWQNELELMMDAAGTGGNLGQSVTGRNLRDVLRPYLETFAAQSGVSVDDLLKDIPMFAANEQYIGMAQADLIQRADAMTADTYRNLDLLGAGGFGTAVYDAEGLDWAELANYGAAQAEAGFMDWNLTDFIMEAWDLTKAEAEQYIKDNHLAPDIVTGETFADTKLYADAMGGQVNVLTEEWMDYYNKVTKEGTDKTIEITQEAFDQLPDIVKIGYSNMGAQFVIVGEQTNDQLISQAEATKGVIEDTWGNIPDHLNQLLKEGWSTETVDGMVTIRDELGNIKFVMPEGDYLAWIESNNTLQEETERLERLRDRLMRIKEDLRGLQGERDRIKEGNKAAEEASGGTSIWGEMALSNVESEISTLEGRADRIREDLGWIIENAEVPELEWDTAFPTQEEITELTNQAATIITSSLSTKITEGLPEVQTATQGLVDAALTVLANSLGLFQQAAWNMVNTLAGTLNSGAGVAGQAGYNLGSAAGLGVLRGLQAHLVQIQTVANQIKLAANVSNSVPAPSSGGSGSGPFGLPLPSQGSTVGTSSVAASSSAPVTTFSASAAGSKTVSVQIGTLNASNEAEVTSLVNRIDEGLGNKWELARRGMYATSGTYIH